MNMTVGAYRFFAAVITSAGPSPQRSVVRSASAGSPANQATAACRVRERHPLSFLYHCLGFAQGVGVNSGYDHFPFVLQCTHLKLTLSGSASAPVGLANLGCVSSF
jgi:hypothetical protein